MLPLELCVLPFPSLKTLRRWLLKKTLHIPNHKYCLSPPKRLSWSTWLLFTCIIPFDSAHIYPVFISCQSPTEPDTEQSKESYQTVPALRELSFLRGDRNINSYDTKGKRLQQKFVRNSLSSGQGKHLDGKAAVTPSLLGNLSLRKAQHSGSQHGTESERLCAGY